MSKKTNEKEDLLNCCADSTIPQSFSGVFRLIYKINKQIEKLQRNNIQTTNLTPTQYLILKQLWENDGRQFKELADLCSCSRSTITGVIDTMEKNKLVKREANLEDRRSLFVKLTEKGKELEKTAPKLDSLMNNCCQGFNQDELKMLGSLLQKLFDSLKF